MYIAKVKFSAKRESGSVSRTCSNKVGRVAKELFPDGVLGEYSDLQTVGTDFAGVSEIVSLKTRV